MKTAETTHFLKRLGTIGAAGVLSFGLACDIDQTRSAELPDIDVDVEADPGRLPAFDVDWADVDVGTRTKMVTVPKVVVVMDEVEVEVPYVDFDMPNAGDKEERTVAVEIEIEGEEHELSIERIYGTGERLLVVSRLTPTGQELGDERIRLQDQVVLSAPELDVRHYIIGSKPDGDWNNQYTFVADERELQDRLDDATLLYNRETT